MDVNKLRVWGPVARDYFVLFTLVTLLVPAIVNAVPGWLVLPTLSFLEVVMLFFAEDIRTFGYGIFGKKKYATLGDIQDSKF